MSVYIYIDMRYYENRWGRWIDRWWSWEYIYIWFYMWLIYICVYVNDVNDDISMTNGEEKYTSIDTVDDNHDPII